MNQHSVSGQEWNTQSVNKESVNVWPISLNISTQLQPKLNYSLIKINPHINMKSNILPETHLYCVYIIDILEV